MSKRTIDAHPYLEAVQREMLAYGKSLGDISAELGQRFGIGELSFQRAHLRIVDAGVIGDLWADRLATMYPVDVPGPALVRYPGLNAYCARCRCVQPSDADGFCMWCDTQTGGNVPPHAWSMRNATFDAPQLEPVRCLYLLGLSLKASVANLVTGNSQISRMTARDCFRRFGWRFRDDLGAGPWVLRHRDQEILRRLGWQSEASEVAA